MSRQLETNESKLLEAIECSKESQVQVENLSQKLESCESARKVLTVTLNDSQSEIQIVRNELQRMKSRKDLILITTSTQSRILFCDKTCNTTDTTISRSDIGIQTAILLQTVEILSSSKLQTKQPLHQQFVSIPKRISAVFPTTERSQIEADDDLTQLISLLNPF
jgi:hypothetical protein